MKFISIGTTGYNLHAISSDPELADEIVKVFHAMSDEEQSLLSDEQMELYWASVDCLK